MIIKTVVNGNLKQNCYILIDGNEALIVDPGLDFNLLKKEVGKLKVLKVLITHYHNDHVGILNEVLEYYNVGKIDYRSLNNIKINNFEFEVIETKGHTDDSCIYYFKNEKVMFTGDFLFKESIGRCDLLGGNIFLMKQSIKKIKKYDKNIKIYPGHYESSYLGYEFINNPYLNGEYYE